MQIKKSYNQEIEFFLKEMGIKKIEIAKILGLHSKSVLNKFSATESSKAAPFYKEDFVKILNHFKSKFDELYNNYTQE